MNRNEHDWVGAHRAREARHITATFTALAVVCCAAGLIPGVEHAVNITLIIAAVLGVLGLSVRLLVRWVCERREEREDAVTAVHWRAAHAPHLLTDTDRTHLRNARTDRAGVA